MFTSHIPKEKPQVPPTAITEKNSPLTGNKTTSAQVELTVNNKKLPQMFLSTNAPNAAAVGNKMPNELENGGGSLAAVNE